MNILNGLCPQCKNSPVVKTNTKGPMPRCFACLEVNRFGRQTRQKANRKLGLWKTHKDDNGIRYPNNRPKPRIPNPEAIERKRLSNLTRAKNNYWKNPERTKRRRLELFLEKAGLSMKWYDQQTNKGCGICGTKDPGRGWNIDHNHSCCPYGQRKGCKNCIRGVLCQACNLAIGMMKDDPIRLRAAADWISKPKKSTY